MLFVKNSGDFVLGLSKAKDEMLVSSDPSILLTNHSGWTHEQIPNNHILEVKSDCTYTFQKLEKKIQIQRNPKTMFNHIMHEEIYESIDAVDQATDFGGKFISNHQVVLGGFEKAK